MTTQTKKIIQPLSKGKKQDNNTPLSFKVWSNSFTGIIPGQEYELYNKYLLDWYNDKKKENVSYNSELRINYILLLKQLQLFFSEEENERWYQLVNFDDEKELLTAIPRFANKLKEIVVYNINLREEIKKTKLKYNTVGTSTGIIQLLQEQLLTTFTKKTNPTITIPSTVWSSIPDLSSVKNDLVVEIEELYDDHIYFDRDPALSATSYFSLTGAKLQDYFTTKKYPLSASEWIYKLGTFDTQNITDEQIENSLNFAEQILQKYIGEDKYTGTNVTDSQTFLSTIYNLNIGAGNNFLYWPYGPYKTTLLEQERLKPVALSSIIPPGATSSETLQSADTIFVKTARGLQGAWLRYRAFDEVNDNLVTYIEGNSKTSFKFPFPGFGLSADDIEWTGPGLKYNFDFFYLDSSNKRAIEDIYWSTTNFLTSVEPILLNDTTLVVNGAYPSEKFSLADKVQIWPSPPDFQSSNYNGEIQEAWLYKMSVTDLPIAPDSNNYLLWPYFRINPNESLPSNIPKDIYTVCQPTLLSGIYLPFATGSDTLSSADIVFKLPNYKSSIFDATECAWLSCIPETLTLTTILSTLSSSTTLIKTKQQGLNLLCNPGTYTYFIWEGDNNTNANDVFKFYKHQPDCTFVTLASSTFRDFKSCTCAATRFSPLGHPGNRQTDYNGLADFIVQIYRPDEPFDLTTWKDEYGTSFIGSSAAAFYRTTNNKIDWGNGTWYTGNRNSPDLLLQKNSIYMYYRAPDSTLDQDIEQLPGLAVKYPYSPTTSNDQVWVKGVKSTDSQGRQLWRSLDVPSDMVISPGNIVVYSKTNGTSFYVLSSFEVLGPFAENKGSIWTNYDFVSLIPDPNTNEVPLIIASYPSTIYTNTSGLNEIDPYQQYPTIRITDFYRTVDEVSLKGGLSALNFANNNIQWVLTDPRKNVYNFFGVTTFSFYPTVTGIYTIAFAALTASQVSRINLTQTAIVTAYRERSIWSNLDFISYDLSNPSTIPAITLSYPTANYADPDALNATDPYQQYPTVIRGKIVTTPVDSNLFTIRWVITSPSQFGETPLQLIANNVADSTVGLSYVFTPSTLGLYTTTITVMTADDPSNPTNVRIVPNPDYDPDEGGGPNNSPTITEPTSGYVTFSNIPPITATNLTQQTLSSSSTTPTTGFYVFTNIPPITATNYTTTTTILCTYVTPSPGFVLNSPLYGWNYNTGRLEVNGIGAKPFWAKSFNNKDSFTNFKGINSWGQPFRIIDEYNIITQPFFSDIILNTGNYFEYNRVYNSPFIWDQPCQCTINVGENVWSTITFQTTVTSNLDEIITNSNFELQTLATNEVSPITLQNFVDNVPVEVYYNAINPFVWSVTATNTAPVFKPGSVLTELAIKSNRPWNSLTNRFYPTAAIFPTTESLYSKEEQGGYFTPKYLGALQYVDENFSANLSITADSLSSFFENSSYRIGGRGLTKKDQPTPYLNLKQNSMWLKEPIVAGPIAGNIKKSIIKKYQKFIPYQSNNETNKNTTVGIITPTSRQDPWGGSTDTDWEDLSNKPSTFTGVVKVSAWAQTQLLKQTDKLLYNWVTDIYGNQYGLYKSFNFSETDIYNRKKVPGEIWVRSNTQRVQPGKDALSAVFDSYIGTSLFNDLQNGGITKIDMFFDTLYIQTTGVVLLEKILYDYDEDKIFSITDDSRYLSLALPVSSQLSREFSLIPLNTIDFALPGDNWFIPEEKVVYLSICGLSGNLIYPAIYELDLQTRSFVKKFPSSEDNITLQTNITNLSLTSIEPPVLSYLPVKKQFVMSVLGKNKYDYIIEMTIKRGTKMALLTSTIYTPVTSLPAFNVPPYIITSLYNNISAGSNFIYTLSAYDTTAIFALVNNIPTWHLLTTTGILSGTAPTTTGIYNIPFTISKDTDTVYYTYTLNVTA